MSTKVPTVMPLLRCFQISKLRIPKFPKFPKSLPGDLNVILLSSSSRLLRGTHDYFTPSAPKVSQLRIPSISLEISGFHLKRTNNFLHSDSSPSPISPTYSPFCITRTANPPCAWRFWKGFSVTGPSCRRYFFGPERWNIISSGFLGAAGLSSSRWGGDLFGDLGEGFARLGAGDWGGVGVFCLASRPFRFFPKIREFIFLFRGLEVGSFSTLDGSKIGALKSVTLISGIFQVPAVAMRFFLWAYTARLEGPYTTGNGVLIMFLWGILFFWRCIRFYFARGPDHRWLRNQEFPLILIADPKIWARIIENSGGGARNAQPQSFWPDD